VAARATAGTRIGVPLDNRLVTAPAAATSAHASVWLRVTWAAIAVGEEASLWPLLTTPTASLTPAGVVPPPWAVPLAEAIQRLYTRDPDASTYLLRAVEATDPERILEPRVAENALNIAAPAMEALYRMLEGERAPFVSAMEKALTLHRKHWEGRPEEPEGWVALFPLAVARMARERGMPVDVVSSYVPAAVLNAAAVPAVVGCPYCLTPIDERWPVCACCLEALGNDAPVELAGELSSTDRKPCVSCRRPIPRLAVRCAWCRARQ
jgi:Immunity protein 49